MDITKAKGKLKWAPSLNVEESIEMTVDWYKKYSLGNKMREVSLKQIEEYSKEALNKKIAWAKNN